MKEAKSLVAKGASLIDVRSARELERGHIEGAINVPAHLLSRRLGEIPRDQPVITYCMAGARSLQAAKILENAGYEVHDLSKKGNWLQ